MSVTTLQESDYTDWVDLYRQFNSSENFEMPEMQYKDTFFRIMAENRNLYALVSRDPTTGKIQGLSHYVLKSTHFSKNPLCF